jgi:tetratricopeptide (TPR) repeat protein
MKQILTLTLILFVFNKTFACLNGEKMFLKDGTFLLAGRDGEVPYGHIFVGLEGREGNVPYGHLFERDEVFKDGIKRLDRLYKDTKDLDYLSDKGLLLILLKRYDEAIRLYLEIEKLDPNRYSTASNIGTAYELLGQNEKALQWIKKSVVIDSNSHKHSEWIHVNILDAKIKGQQFITTNFLLNTDFGLNLIPTTTLKQNELQKLSEALYYQLNERVSFVRPEEIIVAQLLFDLGNVAFLLGNYHDASRDYEEARRYGFSGQLLEQRIKEVELLSTKIPNQLSKVNSATSNNTKTSTNKSSLAYVLWAFGFVLFGTIIILIYKQRKKNKS